MHPSLGAILNKPFALMGIVNVTPDSFSDGGKHATTEAAIEHALTLVRDGADILDVGGESSRPGALPVSAEEELQRVLPVIENLAKQTSIPISIDTTKSIVAQAALKAGAQWINDISAGRFDLRMAEVATEHNCPIILMHSRGTPQTMQESPHYSDLMHEIINELMERVRIFQDAGVTKGNIILDPGIGFGKRFTDNINIIQYIDSIIDTGFPILAGPSRKSFIGEITRKSVDSRDAGTLGAIAALWQRGGRFFRVHNVDACRDLCLVLDAIKTEETSI